MVDLAPCYRKQKNMLEKIKMVLVKNPGLRGREIANELGLDRKAVNSFLSRNSSGLYKDDEHRWFIAQSDTKVLTLNSNPWVTADSFETDYLDTGCFFRSKLNNFQVVFPAGCKILLVAGARIIAIANQLAHAQKNVTLDFSESVQLRHYLNRLGFFDQLDKRVVILPQRPKQSQAQVYKGNSDNLVEIAKIDLTDFDDSIPEQLTAAFVHLAGKQYYLAAFTIFSELIGNVQEHSKTKLFGFAALQKYRGGHNHPTHIQTIVSDSGLGISKTIKQNLELHYPEIYKKLDLNSQDSDIFLVQKALTEGGLSVFGSDPELGRGLGLKRSQEFAVKFNADITIRQEKFEIKLAYRNGSLVKPQPRRNLSIIQGTQVCFDFYLD